MFSLRKTFLFFSCILLIQGTSYGQKILNFDNQELLSFQQSLIDDEITGSNVALIYSKGKKVYHEIVQSNKKGDKDIDEKTIFPIWSMTKPITIVAMLKLHEQGKFDWEDPVSNYIPSFNNLNYKDGTEIKKCEHELKIIHLMTHRSGFKYYNWVEEYPNGGTYGYWTKFNDLKSFVDTVSQYPLEFEPGTQYLYGINQAILGRLVEVLSGQNFEQFLKSNIFNPLGMNDTGFSLNEEQRKRFQPLWINSNELKGFTYQLDELTYHKDNRAYFGGEGLVSTMEDYARFCEMLLGNGVFRGQKIIGKTSIRTMLKPWSKGANDALHEKLKGYHYGFSVFVLDDPMADDSNVPKGIWGWAGYHNTHFWIDPKTKSFGLFMSRAREFTFDIPLNIRKIVYRKN